MKKKYAVFTIDVESFADTGKYEYVKASYLLDRDSLKIIELTY
jgi:hypothetical protein